MAGCTQRAYFFYMSRPNIEEQISSHIKDSLKRIAGSSHPSKVIPADFAVEINIPKDMGFGDLTTNAAMRTAKIFKINPMELSGKIVALINESIKKSSLKDHISKIEIKKPGYINFFFSNQALFNNLFTINKKNKKYGSNRLGQGKKIQIEFVSANPTGPLTVAHGRQAAIGDALSRILRFSGYKVTNEYFVNDEGRQIEVLGESILFHYLSFYGVAMEFPVDGYKGRYIIDIAKEIKEKYRDKFVKDFKKHKMFFSNYGVRLIMAGIKRDLRGFNVCFDSWFYQSSLTRKRVLGVLDLLRNKRFIYDKDGATWFKSRDFGDEKDRVVIKSDGSFTYLAPDIVYHLTKLRRGYARLVDIWGPDHHGYVARIKASIKALGYDDNALSVLLVQLATLYRDGIALSMSTRKGEFITLREIVKEVGRDVTRFFFLMRKLDSHLDFDLEVAKQRSRENPVYYIQYAHARIWSIKNYMSKMQVKPAFRKNNTSLLRENEEIMLSRLLYQFPRYVSACAAHLEPYFMIVYLNELARIFHDFYTKHRVVGEDAGLTRARFFLIECVRICISNGLRLLGVSLPKRM